MWQTSLAIEGLYLPYNGEGGNFKPAQTKRRPEMCRKFCVDERITQRALNNGAINNSVICFFSSSPLIPPIPLIAGVEAFQYGITRPLLSTELWTCLHALKKLCLLVIPHLSPIPEVSQVQSSFLKDDVS